MAAQQQTRKPTVAERSKAAASAKKVIARNRKAFHDYSIEDTFEYLAFTDPEDTEWNHKLLGEWAYEQFELLPKEGDFFDYHGLRFTISSMKNHRILKLTVRRVPEGGDGRE
jgi:CBS domain containing-hemolysin-like protein